MGGFEKAGGVIRGAWGAMKNRGCDQGWGALKKQGCDQGWGALKKQGCDQGCMGL